jgi:DNA-binding response OmpR family regulator
MDARLIREALDGSSLAFDMTVRRDGGEMLATIGRIEAGEEPCPDVFMLDLNLPKYTGAALLSRIRESDLCHGVPVIIVTSSDAQQDRERAVELGATEYFRKSSDLEEFMRLGEIVRAVIERSWPN